MRYLIKFEIYNTVTSRDELKRIRVAAGKQIQKVKNSGKLVFGGMFEDKSGWFFFSI